MLIDLAGRALTSAKRRIRFDQPALARVASMADDAFRRLELTVVCVHCGGTPICANAPTDAIWKMECACTERALVNPAPARKH